MPISSSQIDHLTVYQLENCLMQLMGHNLNYFDRRYIRTLLNSPRGYLNGQRHSANIRNLIRRHRERLEIPPRNSMESISIQEVRYPTSYEVGSWANRPTSFYPMTDEDLNPEAISSSFRNAAQVIGRVVERNLYDTRAQREGVPFSPESVSSSTPMPRFVPSWELSFWKEFDISQDWRPTPAVGEVLDRNVGTPIIVQCDAEGPMPTLKLKDIAKQIPSGVLGLHQVNDEPFNLVLRPTREGDPRLKYLSNHGWFPVHKVEGVWWSPATLEAYNMLFDTGIEFSVTPKVDRWLEDAVSFPPLSLPQECPLFDYQKDGVAFLSKRKRAMLSLSPGLGKTLTSAYAAALDENIRTILLVCPASLLYYWRAELEKWADFLGQKPITVVCHKTTMKVEIRAKEGEQLWIIVNPETLVNKTVEFTDQPDLLLVDESIMYKHRSSKRAIEVLKLAKRIEKVWLLTGAPATRYLDDMWHQLHILNERGYASYWRFANTYCLIEDTQWAKNVVANRRGAEEQLKENLQDVYFARSQDEVTDIPEWLFEDIDIPMTEKQQEVYDKLRKDLLIHLEGEPDAAPLRVKSHIALMLRSLQVLSNPVLVGSSNTSGKWGALSELMYIYPGPYIVWVNFIRTGELLLEALADRLGTGKVALVNGSTPMEERNQTVQSLQDSKIEAIVLNNTVGKFGFNLTRARTSFFVERMYDDSYFQCLHRNRRIGTTQSPIVVNMRSVSTTGKRTLDHAVHDTQDYRTGMIKALTIGDIRRALRD